jgi:hypothetical protein
MRFGVFGGKVSMIVRRASAALIDLQQRAIDANLLGYNARVALLDDTSLQGR